MWVFGLLRVTQSLIAGGMHKTFDENLKHLLIQRRFVRNKYRQAASRNYL